MQTANLWDWVKAVVTVIVVLFLSLKFYNATFTMNFDFIALLSTVLALFSVGLSAIFYFKATETSNNFYNNTFKFTKDIADLLIRIESGFGERLKSLDEGYNSMRSIISHPKHSDVKQTKEKIEVEENELIKINAERAKLIDDLIEKANLEHEEKESIINELKAKEEESQKLQFELAKLKKRLFAERMRNRDDSVSFSQNEDSTSLIESRVEDYIINTVAPNLINSLGIRDSESTPSSRDIVRFFNARYWRDGSSPFARDMVDVGFCHPDKGLIGDGIRFIRKIINTIL